MALATDLMGLGLPARLAAAIAHGGVGPLTTNPAGSAFASATKLGQEQNFVATNNSTGATGYALPTVSGDVLLTDMFVIHNYGSTSVQVYGSTGVIVSAGDSTSVVALQTRKTLVVFPVSSTLWVGGILA